MITETIKWEEEDVKGIEKYQRCMTIYHQDIVVVLTHCVRYNNKK